MLTLAIEAWDGNMIKNKHKYFCTITHFCFSNPMKKSYRKGSVWGCEEMAVVVRNITQHS